MIHYLKTERKHFILSWLDKKSFEIRVNDRNYLPRDEVVLEELDQSNNEMSSRSIHATIESVYEDLPGLKKDYAILTLKINKKEGFL